MARSTEQEQAVGQHHAVAEQQPGDHRPAQTAPRRGGDGERGECPTPRPPRTSRRPRPPSRSRPARAPGTAPPGARRPRPRAPAASTSTATACVAAEQRHDQPGGEPAAEPEPVQQHEEPARPEGDRRRAPATGRPRQRTGSGRRSVPSSRRDVVRARGPSGGTRIVVEDRPDPVGPSTKASASIQASPAAYTSSSRRRQDNGRRGDGDRQLASAGRAERPGAVPAADRGSHRACSGGKERTCTSQWAHRRHQHRSGDEGGGQPPGRTTARPRLLVLARAAACWQG